MFDHRKAAQETQAHYESLWRAGDPWGTHDSEFEQQKYASEFQLLDGRRYGRALEIGCGSGSFTRRLATIADEVLAVDVAQSAIDRAREMDWDMPNVQFRVADVMEWELISAHKWDLITLADTMPCIGAAYTFVAVGCLGADLFAATTPGGRLLMANTYGGVSGILYRPWMSRTYRDMFTNIGYRIDAETLFQGVKDGVEIPVLISLFHKAPDDAETREHELWEDSNAADSVNSLSGRR
jgi:SAM-dependent methyltransferase